MDARRYPGVWWLLVALAACSGSGSSGFDTGPAAESAAIQQALDQQQCVPRGKLTICPADTAPVAVFTPSFTPTPTATPTTAPPSHTIAPAATATPTQALPEATPTAVPVQSPVDVPSAVASAVRTATVTAKPADTRAGTPTPPPLATSTRASTNTVTRTTTPTATPTPTGMRIDTAVDPNAPLPCSATAAGCRFAFPFAPQGFSPVAVFRVAVRTVEPSGAWMIGDEVHPSGPAGVSDFEATVTAPAPGVAGHGARIQIAVLVFLDRPPSVPRQVSELGDSGADFAFVTTALTVQPVQ